MSPRRLALLLAVVVLTGPLVGAGPARATTAGSAPERAGAAAAKVDALLDTYTRAAAAEADGVRVLAQAVNAQSAAELTSVQAAAHAQQAREVQSDRIRALYAQGGPVGLLESILAADSPEDLLQRIGVADRIAGTVLADDSSRIEQRSRAAELARARLAQADAASTAQAEALQRLQDHTATAADALAEAKRTLAGLDTEARQAAVGASHRIEAAQAAAAAARTGAAGPMTALDIPAEYQAAYQAAARTCDGMDWTLLAGVGQVESGHGRNVGPSSAGAIGPMQFMPATFASIGVDGDGDGVKDAWDPQDAIFSAARYLCVSGAAGGGAAGVHKALMAYNHAEWYVVLVLSAQAAIRARLS